MAVRGAGTSGTGAAAAISLTWTTPSGHALLPETRRQNILATMPLGRSTVTAPGFSLASASVAWPIRADWSAGSSTRRAWSLSMTTSLPRASTMPPVRRQARTYSCSSRRSRLLPAASRAWVIWSAVDFTSETSSGSASLRQQVRSITPTVLPETGSWIGTPAQPKRSRYSA